MDGFTAGYDLLSIKNNKGKQLMSVVLHSDMTNRYDSDMIY